MHTLRFLQKRRYAPTFSAAAFALAWTAAHNERGPKTTS